MDSKKTTLPEGAAQQFAGALATVAATAGVGVWQWDLPAGILVFSPAFATILGYAPEELGHDSDIRFERVAEEDKVPYMAQVEACAVGEQDSYTVECRLAKKDGSTVWIKDRCAVTGRDKAGKPVQLTGVIRDITAEKREEAAQKAEARHRAFVRHLVGLAGWEWDIQNDHLTLHDDYQALLGIAPQQLSGPLAGLAGVMPKQDLEELKKRLRAYISQKEGDFTHELRVLHKDGHEIWLRGFGSMVAWDAAGRPTKMRGGVINIDKEVCQEKQLLAAIAKLEMQNEWLSSMVLDTAQSLEHGRRTNLALFEGTPLPVVVFSPHFRPIDCNPAAVRFFGFSGREAMLEGLQELLQKSTPHPRPGGRKARTLDEWLEQALHSGTAEYDTGLCLGTRLVQARVTLKRIPYGDGHAIAGYLQDLTEWQAAHSENYPLPAAVP